MDLIIPYNLEREERRAVVTGDLRVVVVQPNPLPSYSPEVYYPEVIQSERDRIFHKFQGKSSLALLVDDHTRPTPAQFAIPELLDIAEVCRIRDKRIVVAFGSHNFPPEDYVRQKIGDSAYSTVPVILHDAYAKEEHCMIGHTSLGTPLFINRWVTSSDVKVSLGSIFPSSLAGFTGGAKMILPGVAYHESIDHNNAMFQRSSLGRIDGNPMREDMEEAASLAGLDLIIDAVLTPRAEVVSIHVGDPITAHREGAESSRKMYEKRVPRAEIVCVGCGATDDIDFIHLAKALEVADLVCKENGVIVLVGACILGIQWEELLDALHESVSGKESSQGEVFANLFVRRYRSIFLEKTKRVFWVTEPKHEEMADHFGFLFFADLQSAIDKAIGQNRSPITVLPRGSLLLPVPC